MNATNAIATAGIGLSANSVNSQNARNAPSIKKSPCARLTMRMTPNTRLSPSPIKEK